MALFFFRAEVKAVHACEERGHSVNCANPVVPGMTSLYILLSSRASHLLCSTWCLSAQDTALEGWGN